MSAYDPLPGSDGDHDETNSVASSIEGAPPFALGHDDWHLAAEHNDRNLPPPGAVFVHQSTEIAASQAMSTITAKGNQRSSSLLPSSSQLTEHSDRPPLQHHDDGMETYIFDAADSLLGSSQPTMLGSSHLPGSGTLWTHDSTTPHSHSTGSLDFSTLMRQADDRHQSTIVPSRMPTLQESLIDSGQSPASTNSSNVTPRTTNQSLCNNNWLCSLFQGSQPQQQKQPISAVPLMSLSPSYLGDQHMSAGRQIQATRLGEHTFQVSMQIDPPSTVRDVMDVIGNPDLLRLWCDPIRSLVITKSSEGAQSATNRSPKGSNNREYEGEWIEATTSSLVSPSKHSSCLYNLGLLIYTSLGFPSYGKITLFVERPKGQIGLTIGPFSGDIIASHTIRVQDDGPVVSVVDKVRLIRDEEGCVCCCGLCEPIKRCFMPRLEAHMEQAVSSMLRLRALVEHGETRTYAAANSGVGYDEEGVSNIPLLS